MRLAVFQRTARPFTRSVVALVASRRMFSAQSSLSGDHAARDPNDYHTWTHDALVSRVTALEAQLRTQTKSIPSIASAESATKPLDRPISIFINPLAPKRPSRPSRGFDPSRYTTRKIALKIAYLGQRYNGFEHHSNNITPLPTIEEELWKSLCKTRLIFPTQLADSSRSDSEESDQAEPEPVSWDGCEYSKCGRTDKGVSAFGQVIVLRVRSARPKAAAASSATVSASATIAGSTATSSTNETGMTSWFEPATPPPAPIFDDVKDELPYARMLNRVLPDDIRVLAWSPVPSDDFSARFSCRERHYRYFFTVPAYFPTPTGQQERITSKGGTAYQDGWLDIGAMQEAARLYEGLHDFRNFCKVDPARQITNYERRIHYAAIEEYRPYAAGGNFTVARPLRREPRSELARRPPTVYCFTVQGSAFLWHQIRHMVAILFLVGQGLEKPSVVTDLLSVAGMPGKPLYDMATDAPLVLWDCIFPKDDGNQRTDALPWVYTDGMAEENGHAAEKGSGAASNPGRFGPGSITNVLWSGWRGSKIDEVLAGSLLEIVSRQGSAGASDRRMSEGVKPDGRGDGTSRASAKVFDGGNGARLKGRYTPVSELKRADPPDVLNARYAARKPQGTRLFTASIVDSIVE